MKAIGFIEINEYKIITTINDAGVDPEATKAEIEKRENITIDQAFNLENYGELFEKHKVYFQYGTEQILMEDSAAAELTSKFKELDQNQKLLITGEVIPDYVGKEYYLLVDGEWEKRKIERVGEAPEGPLQEELTREQLEEIRTQEEERRIRRMTPEQRAEAVQRELDALVDEAARLEKRAQIQGNEFDAVAWYQEREADVREKYSVTEA